jgi:hypothetical protein
MPPSPGYAVERRAPLVPPPPWLLDLLDPPPPPRSESCRAPAAPDDAAARRLLGLVGLVAAAAEGKRNRVLFWAACRAAEAGLPERSAAVALEEAARAAGLASDEIRRTIASARRRAVA